MAKVQKNEKQVHNMNSPEKLEAIKAAIIAGETPRSIHEKYGTSIVNIHYHKAQLRKQGLLGNTTKSKTGKKATPVKTSKAPKIVKATKAVTAKATKVAAPTKATKVAKPAKAIAPAPAKKPVVVSPSSVTSGKGLVNLVVNGTKITTDKPVKAFKVSKKSVLIEF